MGGIENVRGILSDLSDQYQLDVRDGKIRQTSSRFCLGVEHGDYNGTELFGVGTDRFIWMAYKPNSCGRLRLVSHNFLSDGLIDVDLSEVPPPRSEQLYDSWGRFPCGVLHILRSTSYSITTGIDAVLYSNIPGGGMSRSASLTLNLLLSILDANNIPVGDHVDEKMEIVSLAQRVETEYIGAPVGLLDQVMILFAKEGMGTHFCPRSRQIKYIPLGCQSKDLSIICLDTGTDRPGLEKSTYIKRRKECDELAAACAREFHGISTLSDIKTEAQLQEVLSKFQQVMPKHCQRLQYIFDAQHRFSSMLEAWSNGDIHRVGELFRQDGIGLRDLYDISGPELETMCDIVRTVPGVLGERMLGGGDKGASGCLALSDAVDDICKAVNLSYPRSRPSLKGVKHN
eukprot:gene4925-8712_t